MHVCMLTSEWHMVSLPKPFQIYGCADSGFLPHRYSIEQEGSCPNTLCQSCRSLSYTAIKRNVMDSLSMQISSRCVWQIIEIGRVVNFWYICALCDGNSLHLTGRAVRLERSFHSLCRFRCVDYESITTWLCHTSSCLHHHMDSFSAIRTKTLSS